MSRFGCNLPHRVYMFRRPLHINDAERNANYKMNLGIECIGIWFCGVIRASHVTNTR